MYVFGLTELLSTYLLICGVAYLIFESWVSDPITPILSFYSKIKSAKASTRLGWILIFKYYIKNNKK